MLFITETFNTSLRIFQFLFVVKCTENYTKNKQIFYICCYSKIMEKSRKEFSWGFPKNIIYEPCAKNIRKMNCCF